mgnify:CR=1 FL=1
MDIEKTCPICKDIAYLDADGVTWACRDEECMYVWEDTHSIGRLPVFHEYHKQKKRKRERTPSL